MKGKAFHIVDVFAETRYAGNQLAVVLDAADVDTATMQAFARETNFSETTFVTSNEMRGGGYDVRIFTPREEVPFAGHPTLGTAFVIRRELAGEACRSVVLNLGVGSIPVTFERDVGGGELLWMRQMAPEFGESVDVDCMAAVLGLESSDFDTRHPIQEVSTGLPVMIAPLRGLDAVKRCRVDRSRYDALVRDRPAKCVMVFCAEPYDDENDLNARMFADYFGVPEDPATGSANGCLAGYLARHRYLGGGDVDARVEQGCEIGRPSRLYLRAVERGAEIDVRVGGRVQPCAHGVLD
jgi:trans-2,3-dihydro-3-hydroxyanthranilate isomerase